MQPLQVELSLENHRTVKVAVGSQAQGDEHLINSVRVHHALPVVGTCTLDAHGLVFCSEQALQTEDDRLA